MGESFDTEVVILCGADIGTPPQTLGKKKKEERKEKAQWHLRTRAFSIKNKIHKLLNKTTKTKKKNEKEKEKPDPLYFQATRHEKYLQ